MENILEETRFIMKKYNIRANKSLGQNFLINENVVETIVGSSEIEKEDLVIEIGPGLGTLTKYLLEKAGKVICIELDKKMVRILEDRFKLYNNFELLYQDVLKVDLKNLIKNEKEKNTFKNVKIVESSSLEKEDLVIEIGPGLGTLTKYLLEKAGKVICIELDKKMVKILEDRFKLYNNFELIYQDVLKVDLKNLIKNEKEKNNLKNVKIVANLPYYITTPIIMKLLEEKLDLESITVMIQKEVADRLIATPGDKETGAITYSVYYYATSEGILEVPNDSFIPEPEVTSKVIKLNIRKNPPVEVKSSKVMFRIIKSAFMQRRKTLLNALVNTKVFLNKEEGIKILKKIGLAEDIRAEKLKIEDFAKITNIILEKTI